MSGANVRLHPTAILEDGAEVGPGSAIWHHTESDLDQIVVAVRKVMHA